MVAAASQDDVNAFLFGAREDGRVLEQQGLSAKKPSAIPLEDVELRMDLDEGGLSAGDYTLRLRLGSFSKAQAEAERWQANENLSEARYKLAFNEALHKRYRQFLSVIGLSSQLVLGERRIALLEKQMAAYKSLVDSPEFRFAKLMDVEQDLAEEQLKQIRLQHMRDVAAEVLHDYGAASENSLTAPWLKSVAEVMQVVGNSRLQNISASPLLADTASAVRVAEKNVALQRTKDDVLLSFLDVSYDAGKEGNEAYSVGFAINFPFGVSVDRAVVAAQADLSTARREQQLLQQALPQQLRQTQRTLKGLNEAYGLVTDRLQKNSRSASARSISNPLIMFRVFENTLHWESEEAEIRQKILEHYVDMLHLRGQLAALPLKNYLSKNDSPL